MNNKLQPDIHTKKSIKNNIQTITQKAAPTTTRLITVGICYKKRKTINKMILQTKESIKTLLKKTKQRKYMQPHIYCIRRTTKADLEAKLKGVDLHNPQAIEDALREIPGIQIRNGIFHPSRSCSNGRKLYIQLQDGTKMILEAHTDGRNKNPVIRLYENIPNHSERSYIMINGKFLEDVFRNRDAHILAKLEDYLTWLNAA